MARGFGAAFGVGTTDAISTALASSETLMSVFAILYRNGGGGSGTGRIYNQTNGSNIQVNNANSKLGFTRNRDGGVNGVWECDTTTIPTGSEFRFLLTYDGGSLANDPAVWINGVSQTLTEVTTPLSTLRTSSNPYVIGSRTGGLNNWDGWLAEFAVWYGVLLNADQADYLTVDGGSPLFFPNGLICYVPMVRDVVDREGAVPTVTGTAVQVHPRIIYPPSLRQIHVGRYVLSVTPTAGLLTLSGVDPTVVLGSVSVTPTAGILTLSGVDPTVLIGVQSAPGYGFIDVRTVGSGQLSAITAGSGEVIVIPAGL